jgi:diguanylate cyclase (GGDEF)-like protein
MNLNVSVTGLAIQCIGILVIMSLSFFMTRSIKRTSLEYWTVAWVCLAIALASLSFAFRIKSAENFFFFLYYSHEYAFGLMFIAGCRHYASGEQITRKDYRWLALAILFAALLAICPLNYNNKYVPHFAVIAFLFGAAYKALAVARPHDGRSSPGLRITSLALILLTINFLHYIPVFTLVMYFDVRQLGIYLSFTSIIDMSLETLLGFGTVMLVMEDLRYEVEKTNRELIATRDRLEGLARIDPLTEAFNRHAFYSLTESKQNNPLAAVSGCTVVIDIDNLKPINDRLGHTAGDTAIREVASSLRSVIRAGDMLFRWGGDEFLILLFNTNKESVQNRLSELIIELENKPMIYSAALVPLMFSYGIASFSQMSEIEQAIDKADTAMYECKQSRKSTNSLPTAS